MRKNDDLLAHMRSVQGAERDLRDLGVVWQMIESSAAISCPEEVAGLLPTLVQTRERFQRLQGRLIERMAAEYQAELGDDLSAKAQCAIDILVRNLYERTADVGFLATDDVVRAHCEQGGDAAEGGTAAIRQRLHDYQAKYTVYDDIVLLAPDGRVLARLDERDARTHSDEPLVAQALKASAHVERFGPSDLAPEGASALLYAHRITRAGDGRLLGVLVLRFRFLDEMERIFHDVADERHQMALLLIDEQQRVIASNDEAHVPLQARLRPIEAGTVQLTTFAGREYLAVACASPGYQGYAGPRWRAQAMVSLLTAFRQHADEDEAGRANVPLDNEDLQAICRDADAINRELRRVVWNGRLGTGGPGTDGSAALRLKAVLGQVNTAGQRTRLRVDEATQELYRTALARTRQQAGDLARLAADVLDRNLYERANDCRWWALSPALQRGLAQLAADGDADAAQRSLGAVLDHVNSLYTVYSRLVVFDAAGIIRAVSRQAQAAHLVGQAVEPQWASAVQALHDPQRYAVSDFGPTALHDEGDTYVYLAAIRHPDDRRALGGIAIVFNARQELGAMLRDILGRRAGVAAFVDARGRLLACTDPALAPGSALLQSEQAQALVEHDGAHYACALVHGPGYREFKTSDGHDNGVRALVALRLGATERRRQTLSEIGLRARGGHARTRTLELAVFHVGAARYALPAEAVLTALPPQGLVRSPQRHPHGIGLLEVPGPERARLVQVLSARMHFQVPYPARVTDGAMLVLGSPEVPALPAVGLCVDDVVAVIAVDERHLHRGSAGAARYEPWICGLVDCELAGPDGQSEAVLVQLLDARAICAEVLGTPAAAVSEDALALG